MVIKYIGQNRNSLRRQKGASSPVPKFTVDQIRDFKPIFRFLNQKDRDILFLVFVNQKKQKYVQQILQRSQPSLCYDIHRIRKRIKFIFYINSVFDVFIDFIKQADTWFDTETVEILALMFYTTSFTQTSQIMDVPQIRVRYVFDKTLTLLLENELWGIYEIFINIRSNLNIVKRIYKPYSNSDDKLQDAFIPA